MGAWLRTLYRPRLPTALGCCLALAVTPAARAHLGPPFPIIVDQRAPGYLVNVLANPDVGQAVVIVVAEPAGTGAASPIDRVEVWSEPAGGPRKGTVTAERSQRDPTHYAASPPIDAVGPWRLGAELHLADGTVSRFAADVQATPPGIGPWGLLLFSAPIVLFGALFATVASRRLRRRRVRADKS